MDKVERVYRALSLEEPDKVPKGELDFHGELISAILREPISHENWFKVHVKVRDVLKMDIVNTFIGGGPRPELVGITDKGHPIYRDWVGNKWAETGKTRGYLKHGLATVEDMKQFRMPDISLFNASNVERWVKYTDFCVFAQVNGVFDSVYPLMGLEKYVRAMYTYPDVLKHVIEEVYRFNLEVIRLYAEAGAHVILVGDDLAYDQGPFIPPKYMRSFVFPYLAGEASLAHKLGLPTILHSDGNVTRLIEDIVKAGFDGLHSLQPNAGVDIVNVKRRWGDQLCLMGNLDLDYLMTLGSASEVENEVRRLIREVAPGGGYILSTCNCLTRYVPPENAIAMYLTAEKYGIYPISR